MDYREFEPPTELRHLVKCGWTLDVPTAGPEWVRHTAVPDGCVEIIHRLRGRSIWEDEQPERFVAGVITRPAGLAMGRSSRFVALRIWPWTWRMLSGRSPADLSDGWCSLDERHFAMAETVSEAFDLLCRRRDDAPSAALAEAILASRTCRELSDRTGMSPRALQRWFEQYVGLPPRTWLRLLRFGEAVAGLPVASTGLAEHALDHGFADQSHMAREFRALAGRPARRAKATIQGPFVADRN